MANELIQLKDGVDNAYVESVPYSTDEKRIGTWIDGKPLYRQVFVRTTDSSFPLPSNLNEICRIYGIRHWDNDTKGISFPYYISSQDYIVFVSDGTIINVRKPSDLESTKLIVILEYTKTTD